MTAKAPNILIVMADQDGRAGVPADLRAMRLSARQTCRRWRETGLVFDSTWRRKPVMRRHRAPRSCPGLLPSRTRVYDNAARVRSRAFRPFRPRSSGFAARCTAPYSPARCTSAAPISLHGFEQRLTTDIYPRRLQLDAGLGSPPSIGRAGIHNMSSVRDAGLYDALEPASISA